MHSTGQAVVHHAVRRPLQAWHQDPSPGTAQQPATPSKWKLEADKEQEKEVLAGGDAMLAAQPRH